MHHIRVLFAFLPTTFVIRFEWGWIQQCAQYFKLHQQSDEQYRNLLKLHIVSETTNEIARCIIVIHIRDVDFQVIGITLKHFCHWLSCWIQSKSIPCIHQSSTKYKNTESECKKKKNQASRDDSFKSVPMIQALQQWVYDMEWFPQYWKKLVSIHLQSRSFFRGWVW